MKTNCFFFNLPINYGTNPCSAAVDLFCFPDNWMIVGDSDFSGAAGHCTSPSCSLCLISALHVLKEQTRGRHLIEGIDCPRDEVAAEQLHYIKESHERLVAACSLRTSATGHKQHTAVTNPRPAALPRGPSGRRHTAS